MPGNSRIPPAINEVFVQIASQVCDRSRMDYDEWLVNSQELVFHLQERWREGISLGLSTDAAQSRAMEMFGDPIIVAKSLRKPWLERLLFYDRFRPERYGFFILAFFFYTWHTILDTHWRDLVNNVDVTPFQILLPFNNTRFYSDGVGAMFVGFAASACVVLSKWQPHYKTRLLNQLMMARHVALLLAGYACFLLIVRFPYLAYTNLPELFHRYSYYSKILVPFSILHLVGIALGWFGSLCLFLEIWGRSWKALRMNFVLMGALLAFFINFGLPFSSSPNQAAQMDAPTQINKLNYDAVEDTKTGKVLRKWMSQHIWTRGWRQNFTNQEQVDDKITQSFSADTSDETYEFIYVFDGGIWKFDDVYLETYKGADFQLYLSLIVQDPKSSEGFVLLRNKNLTDVQRKVLNLFFH